MVTVRRTALISIIAVPFITALLYAGEDPKDAQPSPGDRRVTLNQSVFIDQAASQALTAEKGEAAVGGRTGLPTDAEASGTPRTLARRRGARERESPHQASGAYGARQTPWYRKGAAALAVVLALLVAAAWAVRRWAPIARSADSGVLRVVARASLTPKHNLALVRVGRRFVLVGASADRVNALCEVCDPDEVAQLTACCDASRRTGAGPFDDLLIGEAADYRETPESEEDSAKLTRTEPARTRAPLNDLLRRLRSLQTE